ncbi:MAG: hypothetical protein QOI57_3089 [Rubrobacteraceae bacterium]|nr:hypothetical protein [Rubrobacteraceae bacterium]
MKSSEPIRASSKENETVKDQKNYKCTGRHYRCVQLLEKPHYLLKLKSKENPHILLAARDPGERPELRRTPAAQTEDLAFG